MADEARQQEIMGWVGISKTSKDDMLIYLYDSNPALEYAIVNLYEEDFEKMPPHFGKALMAAVDKEGVNEFLQAAPKKSEAQAKGWLREIEPPFHVMVHKKKINWGQTGDLASGKPAVQMALAGQVAQQAWAGPLTGKQLGLASELVKDVVGLQWALAIETVDGFMEAIGTDTIEPELYANLVEPVFRGASFDFAKVWPSVRGAVMVSTDEAASLDGLFKAVHETEPEKLFDLLADKHSMILDAGFAKIIFKTLGMTSLKPRADGRVEQAKKAVMYIELTTRHGLEKEVAIEAVNNAFDQIPF